jgi:hypothetical protein
VTDKQPEEKQVPLYELLEDIPEDFRIGIKDNDNWSAGVTWHPIGVMCHQAAAELRRLHEVNAPPQREWQSLTDEEKSEIYNRNYNLYAHDMHIGDFFLIQQAIEAKLKEKNT